MFGVLDCRHFSYFDAGWLGRLVWMLLALVRGQVDGGLRSGQWRDACMLATVGVQGHLSGQVVQRQAVDLFSDAR